MTHEYIKIFTKQLTEFRNGTIQAPEYQCIMSKVSQYGNISLLKVLETLVYM